MLWVLLFFSICLRAHAQSSNHSPSDTYPDAATCIEGTGPDDWRDAHAFLLQRAMPTAGSLAHHALLHRSLLHRACHKAAVARRLQQTSSAPSTSQAEYLSDQALHGRTLKSPFLKWPHNGCAASGLGQATAWEMPGWLGFNSHNSSCWVGYPTPGFNPSIILGCQIMPTSDNAPVHPTWECTGGRASFWERGNASWALPIRETSASFVPPCTDTR